MARRTKTSRPQVGLRVSEDMRVRLEKAAKKSGRSINSEILERLEESFETETQYGGPLATVLIDRIGRAMAAVGECDGFYTFNKTGHGREWLSYQIPYARAAAAAVAILEINWPKVDGAVPSRTAAEGIKRTAAEVIERSAVEVERLGEIAAAEGSAPSTTARSSSMEAAAMWDRAIRKSDVRYGFAPAVEASEPQKLNEKIQRVYADLAELFAFLETRDREEKTDE